MTLTCTKSYFQRFCDDGFQMEGNGYSFSSDLLPSLGATINQSVKLRKFKISPYDPRYRWTFHFMYPILWQNEREFKEIANWFSFYLFFCFLLRAWDMFLILLVIYSAWICPFELAFLRHLPTKLFVAENIVNSFFAVDIVLTFFVAYLDRKSYLLIDDPKRIATRLVWEFNNCSVAALEVTNPSGV